MRKALLLLSSGLDSAANLYLAKSAQFDVELAVTLDYGQRSAPKEIESSKKLAKHFGVSHMVLDLRRFPEWLGSSGSALLDEGSVPIPDSLDDISVISKTAKAVWVPNRNGVFISIAAAIAEARDISVVLVGFNAEEAVTFADNTQAFVDAMNVALSFSTSNQVRVESATVDFTKREVVQHLIAGKDRFPFEFLWSCYLAGENHCGECESCQRLKRALITADVPSVVQSLFPPVDKSRA